VAETSHLQVDLARAGDSTAFMRAFLSALFACTLLLEGCASHRGGSPSFVEVPSAGNPPSVWPKDKLIFSPDNVLTGKVVKVNVDGRFVVLSFPIGRLPTLDQRLSIYRRGLKTGEVRVTGPQLDDNVVGDIVVGDAQTGDEVRAE
jgi:hypothetical protein